MIDLNQHLKEHSRPGVSLNAFGDVNTGIKNNPCQDYYNELKLKPYICFLI